MPTIDEKNFKWFQHDHSKASLVTIKIERGELRGLKNMQLDFEYPITAIAGRNGCGKTTILAIAACAYHNNDLGFKPFGREQPYYTFSDFFIQSSEEVPPDGIALLYKIRHDRWKMTKDKPNPRRDGWYLQDKRQGGRWRRYSSRMKRNVVYLGIERVLPDVEKSTSKSYSKVFEDREPSGWENEVRAIVGRILSRRYDDFRYAYTDHGKYRLPVVRVGEITYSGFNMGAGESALFEIFSTIFDCTQKTRENRGVLILVDEIELGLHEEAQIRLMEELKQICSQKQVQVICTTHSAVIFDALPPQGRILIERQAEHTEVMYGVSSAFAMGKLSGNPEAELDVFVEDEVAKTVLENTLQNNIRARINILPIGSANALMQQIAARYKELQAGKARPACIIFDGDELALKSNRIRMFCDKLESFKDDTDKTNAEEWVGARIEYLPGDTWPEKWILSQELSAFAALAEEYRITQHELKHLLEQAMLAGKHNEFWNLTQKLNLNPSTSLEQVRARFSRLAMGANPMEVQRLNSFVKKLLEQA